MGQPALGKHAPCHCAVGLALLLGACATEATPAADAAVGAGGVDAGAGSELGDSAAPKDAAAPKDGGLDAAVGTDAASSPDKGGADAADAGPPAVLQPRPLKFGEDLLAVWGSNASDVWLVGKQGRVLHWNGKTLVPRRTATAQDPAGTAKDFHGVWGRAAKDVWLAGDGIVLHWTGSGFEDRTPKEPAGAVWHAVHALPGGPVYLAADAGVVVRLDSDGVWKKEATNSQLNLRAVRAIGPGQVWVAGDNGQALKLAGGSWSATALPKANARALRALDVSPAGRIFTVGDQGFLAATKAGVWEATPANDPDEPDRDLSGVWARGDNDAWAIGAKGILFHLTAKWNVVPIVGPYMTIASFRAIWGFAASDKEAWAVAVGDKGAGIVMAATAAGGADKWTDFPAETGADLQAVTALQDGRLIACGDGGTLLEAATANAPFFDLAAPVTAAALLDVAVANDGGLAAVGEGGVAVRRPAGGAFAVDKVAGVGADGFLRGIAPLGDGWLAVGDAGLAAAYTAAGWKGEPTGTAVALRSVTQVAGTAYAVGDAGTVLRRSSNGKWTAETTNEVRALYRVVAWSADEAAAVGEGGVVLVRTANGWKTVFEAPDALFLYGLTRRADGTLIAVGYAGAVVVGKPAGPFQRLDGKVGNRLHGVAATPLGTVAVGMKGGVFQLAEKLP